ATWKRELDGVVMMDQHRCIGCRFCMAACPFGARSFNYGDPRKAPKELNPDFPTNMTYPTRTKGVVEKCNFCAERLAKGQLPACVEVASKIKAGALTFGDLEDPDSEIRAVLREHYTIRRKPELGTGPNVYYII
ncbi:MAG: 4Fe-4S dicluster domain-containing protein, partial [Deltaproteobacteria bacterium]